MAGSNMLERTILLDPQPGGVLPEFHIKKGTSSMKLRIMIAPDGITDFMYKPTILRGVRPDGVEVSDRAACYYENLKICVHVYESVVRRMAEVPGRYKMTLTIVGKSGSVSVNNYMDYDIQTVLPFMVIVE